MKKQKIIDLLKNDSIREVTSIEIIDSFNCEESKIEIFYKNEYGNIGIITQRF